MTAPDSSSNSHQKLMQARNGLIIDQRICAAASSPMDAAAYGQARNTTTEGRGECQKLNLGAVSGTHVGLASRIE